MKKLVAASLEQIRVITAICLLCAALLLSPACSPSSAESIPRFTWAAFQRFWNANSIPGGMLKNDRVSPYGREINIGPSLRVLIWIEENTVKGVRIRYNDPTGLNEHAMTFVKMIRSAVNVGTFRWPADKAEDAKRFFYEMSEIPAEYRYMVTLFRRFYTQDAGWEFSFVYAPPEKDMSNFVWPDEEKRPKKDEHAAPTE